MHFISQSITLHIIVLMAVCAHQLHMTPVKEETLIRVETEISESEGIRHHIRNPFCFQFSVNPVQIRRIHIPQTPVPD